ncbi:SEC-C metal-binding domain-containing protein [Haliscomenobacter hydrossis]|uniref:SEC-C motif domain protein n=1 Tax=Haliscomenobacter hydrossis (strain ATCC 27775 / DSM 1100 / LMG 10767 / O) TaxID=760192 RepID=F4L839_HALH1|nr:SEC-C metal-binding domain-containing protein [Haliscomenobacter hydrossis]AEE54547.1 SEC-C motif domain protein [Haliscomenobacter hydrossis DSM 1100]
MIMPETPKEIVRLLKEYRGLTFDARKRQLKGKVDIINKNNPELGALDSFSLLIKLSDQSNLHFPKVYETAGTIPREGDRHINSDGSMCLAVPPEEARICRRGITLLKFFEEVLIPFLAVQSAINKKLITSFPQGEYGHGDEGVLEFYQQLFRTQNMATIVKGINTLVKKQLSRNEPCFCGSNQKAKNCHNQAYIFLKSYPPALLLSDLQVINSINTDPLL